MNKLFSIVIPTRNRQQYCIEAGASILKEIDESCELVVQDNSTDDTLRQHFVNLNDSRVIYNYNPTPLSFVDNFEEALQLSNGTFFCILGDDDSVTKNIMQIVHWMRINNIDSVASTRVVDFIWPNSTIEKYANGELTIPKYGGKEKAVNPKLQLLELLRGGFLSYQTFELPRTYHGIIRRSCMNEVKRLGGRYFGGLTPDIYSTVALSCIVKKHFIIDFPFSIAGACPASATAMATVGGHSGKLTDAPHFRNRGTYQWEVDIPKYYSVETIWAESGIKALKDLRQQDLLSHFNKYRLYIYAIVINRKYIFDLSFKETISLYKPLQITCLEHIIKLLTETLRSVIRVAKKRLKKQNFDSVDEVFSNVYSLEEAKDLTASMVKNSYEMEVCTYAEPQENTRTS